MLIHVLIITIKKQVNSVGAVLGGETKEISRVDALGLRSEVVMTVREPPTGDAVRDEYDSS